MASISTKAYGASGSVLNSLKRMDIEREEPKEDEVQIDLLYCGVCHSDLHQVKKDWSNTLYPCITRAQNCMKSSCLGRFMKMNTFGDCLGRIVIKK